MYIFSKGILYILENISKYERGAIMFYFLGLEWKKVIRSKFALILLSIVLIFLGSYFFYIDQKEMSLQEMKENVQNNLDMNIEGYESTKAEIEEIEAKGEFIDPIIQNNFNMYERQLKSYRITHEGINTENWSLFLQGEIDFNSLDEEEAKRQLEEVAKAYIWPTPFTILSGMDQLRWMEERNIRPVFPTYSSSWRSIYDEEFSEPIFKQIVEENSDKHSSAGLYFTYEALNYGLSILGVVFFVFFFGDILTREGFGKNGPIHMLRTQPIRRWKFWLSKGITVIGGSLLIILGMALIGIALGVIFNRLGDWDYPILIYGPDRTYSFLPLAVFLGKALALFLLILGLGFSLLFLFSVLTNRAITAIGLTLVVLFGGQMFAEQAELLTWSHWLPFHYFDVYSVATGEYAILQNNELYTYNTALISLSITIVLILLLTFVVGKLRKGVIS